MRDEKNQIFAVIAASHPEKLQPNIDAAFPDRNLSVGLGQ
jgi:hypothetical protein